MKAHFPIFKHNPSLVYLDSASTAQKLNGVIDREKEFYEQENANVHRGLYKLSSDATENFERVRKRVAAFIGGSSNEIAFSKGTTESINIVAKSFRNRLRGGDNIVVTAMEHHANFIPWQQACLETGAEFRVAPITLTGDLDLHALEALLDDRTKALAITHISNVLGTINPIQEIIKLAHKKNIPVLIDAAQSVGHVDLDVDILDVDFLVFSAHKLFGPMGVGVLYAKAKHHPIVKPLNFGGGIVKNVTKQTTEFLEFPRNVEAGTPNVAGVMGLGAAIDFLADINLELEFKRTQELAQKFRKGLSQLTAIKVKVLGNSSNAAPIVSFAVDGVHAHDVAGILAEHNIAVRAGHHCAQPLHDVLGVEATVRASFSIYNTEDDVQAILTALGRVGISQQADKPNQLYSWLIREHNNKPYHFKKMDRVSPVLSYNPVCGDKFEFYFDISADTITSVYFYGIGCAVSKASASVLTKLVEGVSILEAMRLIELFLNSIDKDKKIGGEAPQELTAFYSVRQFPERYECAALPWLETQKYLTNLVKKS